MMLGHLVAGLAEAVVAGAGVSYLAKSAPEFLELPTASEPEISPLWKRLRAMWIMLAVLIILTPLGLLAPGTAWGEWGSDQLRSIGLGFVPEGMKRWEGFWNSIFADYSFPGLGENTGYVISAVLGVLLIAFVFWILTLMGRKKAIENAQ